MQVKFKHKGRYPFLFSLLPLSLQNELQFLRQFFSPYTHKVYMVGGSVRDMLRIVLHQENVDVVDLDLEVYGIDEKSFALLMQELGAKGVGKSYFVYKYKEYIDISLPRIESKVGVGHKAFAVKLAKDEKEASKRRDFKMNALMLSIFDATLLDFWGGIEDIENKRIAIIDEEKFKEDSLRVLRGMQFSARFGYKIEPRSCEVMRSIELSDLSKERIFWEFEKMFLAKYLHYGLYALVVLHIDRKIFDVVVGPLFFKIAKELLDARKNFQKELYKFYFLYIVAKNLHKNFLYFLDRLQTPNEYYKIFRKQKSLPKRRSDRFLAAMAMRLPLKEYLGNYKEDVTIRAKKFGFWDRKFTPISAKVLMAQGYRGRELGEELRRRTLQIIKERFKR